MQGAAVPRVFQLELLVDIMPSVRKHVHHAHFHTSRPAYTNITDGIVIADNCLYQNGMPTFRIVILSMQIGWYCHWDVGSNTLWYLPMCFESTNGVCQLTPCGKTTISENNMSTMALHVSLTMTHTVDLATPKRCPMVRYSQGVAESKW